MNLRDLVLLYGIIGLACAIAVWRHEQRHGPGVALRSALATLPLWPLWAPFVLTAPHPRAPRGGASWPPGVATGEPGTSGLGRDGPLPRIEHALEESVRAVAGTPMNQVFTRQVAQRIAAEVALVAGRTAELSRLVTSRGLDPVASAARLRELEADGAADRTIATARLQHESLARLSALRDADREALEELADLLEALRAQLLLARYAGASADGTGAIVSEVWARLEGLGAALDVPAATPGRPAP